MTTLIALLAQARAAGLRLADEDGTLRIRGPRSHEALVRQLLDRKADVLSAVHVFNRAAERLDWRKMRILDETQPCTLCGKKTLLLDPWDGQPTHKGCAEAAIRSGAASAVKKGQAA